MGKCIKGYILNELKKYYWDNTIIYGYDYSGVYNDGKKRAPKEHIRLFNNK